MRKYYQEPSHISCVWILFFFMFVINTFMTPSSSLAEQPEEYPIKAAVFYHFTHFVNWPDSTFAATNGHLRICVVGKDPFGKSLDSMLSKKAVRERPFEIRRNLPFKELKHCHLLYFSAAASSKFQMLRQHVEKDDVLTVGETREFMKYGGMIKFFVDNQKLGFEVNVDAINQTNLKVSSKLLRLADIYLP